MEGINIQKTKNILKSKSIYISLAIAFALMLLIFPKEGKFKYEYQKGRPWLYQTLIAPIDFPILKTQAELIKERDAAAEKIIPYYIYDKDVVNEQLQLLSDLVARRSLSTVVENAIVSSFQYIYNKGILQRDLALSNRNNLSAYILIQRNKRAEEEPIGAIYTKQQAQRALLENLKTDLPDINVDTLISNSKLYDLLVPNLIYDQQTTNLVHKEALSYISPTKGMIYTGQLIVSEGETITAEIQQLLDSYKAEYELNLGYSGGQLLLILGHALVVLVILFLVYATVYFVNIEVFRDKRKLSFILSLIVLNFVITVLVRSASTSYLYMVPYAVFALYMMAFFQAKMVFPIYMISLMPLLVIAEYGIELYVLNVFAGAVALMSFVYLNRGWLQFLNSLIIFVGSFLVFLSFRLMESGNLDFDYSATILYIFLNALFVVAAYPLVFLLEKIFSLVSVSTLKDLSDTNNTLLQELAKKAPGTFQHSLQVANLSERAVLAIRGDSRLVKVGAMYHDVGKLINPQCFIENQAPNLNYHGGLSPEESAKEIIKHVADGVELAKKYNLPQIITDFITSHHGRSTTRYFYAQYCNNGGDPSNKKDFTYDGTLPTTKEQVVVMMADAVEAASRTLKDYSLESITKLVDSITSERISDSQLVKADISIKEINIVKTVFKKHIQEIYHSRIAYPTKN